ncbi:glycoside hydrolase family 95 protein [Paenibacillus guangzhouensis]|uniref:glycoside hydrolase family 95 protein n=1 Tax=Paenibacillus guangzhouensis TaxID=1473112 RepID=UPI001267693F|nr:glycoside hydrolase family 95 protein [Paenibacillus guangzhouensis]
MQKAAKLWYKQPAVQWTEALPLGNGRMGAMVFGGVERDRLQMNEDTLWAGYPREEHNPNALTYLAAARDYIAAKQYAEAEALVENHMLGTDGHGVQPYQPLGNVYLDFEGIAKEEAYTRELDLHTAIATTKIGSGDEQHIRKVFISAVDQVMAVRLEAAQANRFDVTIAMDSLLRYQVSVDGQGLLLMGTAPTKVQNHNNRIEPAVVYDDEGRSMRFAAMIKIAETDGNAELESDGIYLKGATYATLLYTSATSYSRFDEMPGQTSIDPAVVCRDTLQQAGKKCYVELEADHVTDYQRLHQRVDFELHDPEHEYTQSWPTDERLKRMAQGKTDLDMSRLLFQYGRYLLISSSRPGTQPANLQGIWNDMVQPPWNADFHLNINLQMNYWLAESCHLSECHEPLFQLIEEQAVTGAKTARIHYGCDGWTAHTMSDIWRTNNVGPTGEATWAYWPMGGAWLCQHLWEHYLFNQDISFLREKAWPLMRGAAEFMLDWLIENEEGQWITSPSTSPENHFYDPVTRQPRSVTEASAMDLSIAWEMLSITEQAGRLLGVDETFTNRCEDVLIKLKPLQISSQGYLVEWNEDFEEVDPQHRHFSHLFGLYPGRQFTMEHTPAYCEAMRNTMERRGDEGTGWSMGWKVAVWARLRDGDRALRLLDNFMQVGTDQAFNYRKGGIYPNLFCAHPPFQIDGNFGAAAGIAEMLLQSHLMDIHLLPALPAKWQDGYIHGLRARGGYTVSMVWLHGKLTQATIIADRDSTCQVRYQGAMMEIVCKAGVAVQLTWAEEELTCT